LAAFIASGKTIYNVPMRSRSQVRFYVLAVLLCMALLPFAAGAQQKVSNRGRKFKMPPPTARIEVSVVRDATGKPIENAAVIFHAMEGERDKGNMELKTNEDGKTVIDVMPIGDVVRLQVIAKGFQTFGDDYKVDKDQLSINIRMKRPGEQYSIYKEHADKLEGGKSVEGAKPTSPADTDKDKSVPSPKDKTAAQPDAQPKSK
jgi:hypothetical protein